MPQRVRPQSSTSSAAARTTTTTTTQRKHKPFQTGSMRRCQRRSRVRQCVCICMSLPNALVYRFCACVCSSPNHRREPLSLSLSLSHSLRLALLFAELPVRAAWPAWQVTVSANEREIPIALWTNCDCAIAWHRFINWFLLWFSQLVRCGAVCVRSVNERYSHTTHAFLFRQFFSIIGFLSLLEEREREGERMSLRKYKNPVNNYFIYNDDIRKSTCKICYFDMAGRHSENLMRHLKRKHPLTYSQVMIEKQRRRAAANADAARQSQSQKQSGSSDNTEAAAAAAAAAEATTAATGTPSSLSSMFKFETEPHKFFIKSVRVPFA